MVASETLCLRSEMSFFGAGCRTASSSFCGLLSAWSAGCSLLPNLEFFIEVFSCHEITSFGGIKQCKLDDKFEGIPV